MATVALGEVLQNVEKMKCFTFRHKVSSKTNSGTPEETSNVTERTTYVSAEYGLKVSSKTNSGTPEETSNDTERTTYVSAEYGLKHDVYKDGQLTGILYIPSSGIDVT